MENQKSSPDEVDMASIPNSELDPCNYEFLEANSFCNVQETRVLKKRKVSNIVPVPSEIRHRVYPDDFGGPWVVYFRPIDKPLNIMRIQQDLDKYFPAVSLIRKTSPNRLRVEVDDRKQANDIVKFELFTRQYRVYIPARDVEIDGVVTEGSLKREDLLNGGLGCFNNPAIKPVPILECKQLLSASKSEDKTTYTLSGSFRVTFAGSALPNYISIGKVRLPVRLFIHRVMTCLNCKKFGHTNKYCSCKTRCGNCGEDHQDSVCGKTAEKCVYCGGDPHTLIACPMYKMRGEKLKRSLKARSQQSYADMLKKSITTISDNPFEILSDNSDEDEVDEGCPANQVERLQKRKNSKPLSLLRRDMSRRTAPVSKQNTKGNTGNSFCCTTSVDYSKEFPALPGTSTTPDVPKPAPPSSNNNTSKTPNNIQEPSDSGLLRFETVVEWILDALDLSVHQRNFIVPLVPKLKGFVQKLCVKLPIISVFINFDD